MKRERRESRREGEGGERRRTEWFDGAKEERRGSQTAEASTTVGEAKGDTTGASPRDTQVGVAPIPTRRTGSPRYEIIYVG